MGNEYSEAIKLLESKWEAMQPGRYQTLTESDEDAAFINGFHHAIECLKESSGPKGQVENAIESIREPFSQLTDDERYEAFEKLMEGYCKHCGGTDVPCYCTWDE